MDFLRFSSLLIYIDMLAELLQFLPLIPTVAWPDKGKKKIWIEFLDSVHRPELFKHNVPETGYVSIFRCGAGVT
jgi:hypothetical protein